jgi:tellurite resistance protein TerC
MGFIALSGIEKYFTYLKYGLAVILIFVGVKMCIVDFYKVPFEISLTFIISTL